jgi:DNA replication protein DnaC
MTEAPKILLAHHLKTLKLPTFLREYEKVARQCAAEGLDHVQFLSRLVELELIDRERRMVERRIKAAKFPATKSLDSFDFKAIPKLNKMQVLELARCDWIERRKNVIALGPSGTGETQVSMAGRVRCHGEVVVESCLADVIADRTRFPAYKKPGQSVGANQAGSGRRP